MRRLLLTILMAVLSLNIWTGSPLFAVWVGSRVQGESGPSMGAIFVVVAVLSTCVIALTFALGAVGAAHDRLTGRPPGPREPAPWLRSMRGERGSEAAARRPATALERVLVVMVLIAFAAFETWFFFFSGSSIGHG